MVYVLIRCGLFKYDLNSMSDDRNGGKRRGGNSSSKNSSKNSSGTTKISNRKHNNNNNLRKRKNRVLKPKMISFHRPFHKLAKNATILSGVLCLLYAYCWSRTLSIFKTTKDNGAGLVCRAVFTLFVPDHDDIGGAKEGTIWYIWLSMIFIMILSFAQDEWNGLHYSLSNDELGQSLYEDGEGKDDEDEKGEKDEKELLVGGGDSREGYFRNVINSLSRYLTDSTKEGPTDTLDMVSLCFFLQMYSHIFHKLVIQYFSFRINIDELFSIIRCHGYRLLQHLV